MLYKLSKIIPVPMRSTYGLRVTDAPDNVTVTSVGWQRATWWQWRGRIWRHRVEAA